MEKKIIEFTKTEGDGHITIEVIMPEDTIKMIDEIKGLQIRGSSNRFMLDQVEPDYIKATFHEASEEMLEFLIDNGWTF